jgi:phosphonate transport system substrate-binding protein
MANHAQGIVAGVLAGLCLSAAPSEASRQQNYTLAIVPYQTPQSIYKDWSPLTARLSTRLDAKIELLIYRSIPSFEAELLKGIPDFAFMNPYHQVMARKRQGYLPLVRSENKLTGILVVRRDSPVRTVQELEGRRMAFPAPNAFGASLYMRTLLIEREKLSFKPYYVNAHNEVYRHVILGEADAGGGISHTFNKEPDSVKKKLRILYETPTSAPHALAVHPRIQKSVWEAVIDTILSLNTEPAYEQLLQAIHLAGPIRADYQRDYAPLEYLGLEKYVVPSDR